MTRRLHGRGVPREPRPGRLGVGGGARRRAVASGGEAHSTNQRMEIQAALRGDAGARRAVLTSSATRPTSSTASATGGASGWLSNGWTQPPAQAGGQPRPVGAVRSSCVAASGRRTFRVGQGPQRRPDERPRRPAGRRSPARARSTQGPPRRGHADRRHRPSGTGTGTHVEPTRPPPNVARHGHHRCKRNRHGWGVGHRRGDRPAAGRQGAPRSSSPTCRRTRARHWPTRSAARSARSTSPSTDDIVNAVEMAKSMGPLRVLVNSAGIGWAQRTIGKDGSYDSAANLDVFKKVIAINLIGTFNCIRIAGDGDEHRPSRWSTASAARSSTSPRSPPSTARSARRRTRRRRAASSA